MKKRRSPEEQLQRSVASYLNIALPSHVEWFAVPNGGWRTKAEGGALKAQGVKAGIPDLAFIHDGAVFFIELKSASGRLSKAQGEMIPRLKRAGAETFLCRSIEDVTRVLTSRGIELRAS